MSSFGKRLEQYTLRRPNEVLIVDAVIDGENDQVLIFKGFSSSLLRSTAYDPDVPILPSGAEILSIDRLQSPYHPTSPHYLEQGLSLEAMETLLAKVGV
ncbi:MAG: hypothetical protein HC881_09735 [Leptolyngbyaceae cyanobacterium SL_7_1]|nr:hypothetical protein [Leptolyngbyaceae cyanobacterium SL_7_1]